MIVKLKIKHVQKFFGHVKQITHSTGAADESIFQCSESAFQGYRAVQ